MYIYKCSFISIIYIKSNFCLLIDQSHLLVLLTSRETSNDAIRTQKTQQRQKKQLLQVLCDAAS